MSTIETNTPTLRPTAMNGSERRAAAQAWLEAAADGEQLSGAQLGERFGRSPRWGRAIIAECRPLVEARDRHNTGTPQVTVSRGTRSVTVLAVLVVAGVAAVVSYAHMRALALAAGEEWRSVLLPLSVDGLIIAASMTMLVRRRLGESAGPLAWLSLLLGIAASVAANIASAEPTVAGRLIAGWSPMALLLSFELLLQQGRGGAER